MALVTFDLSGTDQSFRQGFFAALDFLDGVPQGSETISLLETHDNYAHLKLSFDDGGDNDNRGYVIEDGKVKFNNTGIEW
jgi:hypothetical protein